MWFAAKALKSSCFFVGATMVTSGNFRQRYVNDFSTILIPAPWQLLPVGNWIKVFVSVWPVTTFSLLISAINEVADLLITAAKALISPVWVLTYPSFANLQHFGEPPWSFPISTQSSRHGPLVNGDEGSPMTSEYRVLKTPNKWWDVVGVLPTCRKRGKASLSRECRGRSCNWNLGRGNDAPVEDLFGIFKKQLVNGCWKWHFYWTILST